MEDGRISYVTELSEKGFAEGARNMQRRVRKLTEDVERSGTRMEDVFDRLGKKVAGAFAVGSIVEFEKKIIEVRSEFESLQKSFESLAGEHVGRKLYEDIKQFATTTPMMAKDLAKGAQTLLGFNIEAEKVMPILRQIGDISMGDAQKFNSLTLAFAQMSSTGKLMGQDLLQMINAGFNPLVVISEKTGKSIASLKDEMSKGAITVEMVEDAFRAATSEGGKFHNMLESQSKTMKGALSNLQGAYEDMLNEIGEKQQGLMLDTVNLAQSLVQNYEKVGQVLLGLIATYGTYRAAVMAVSVAEGVANGQIVLKIRALRACAAAQALLNKTMLLNPYVLAATALGVLVGSIIAARDGLTDAERAQRDYNKVLDEAKQKQEEYNGETQEAIRLANDDSAATGDRESAMQTLIGRYPEIIKKYIDEKGHLTDILNLKREIAAYDGEMANLDNKTRADMYNKYIRVLEKARRGEQLNETESIMYEGARKKYNDATPWYTRFLGNYTGGAIDYFQQMSKQASYAYKRYGTEQKVSKLMDDMGSMDTKKLESLVVKLQAAEKQIKGHVAVKVKEVGDFVESSDITSLLTKAEGILNARSGNKKGLTDAEKKAAAKAAEKAAKENAAEREKLFELELADMERQAKQKANLESALADKAIAEESNAAKREIMQMERDHKERLASIDQQAEEMRKANYEAQKKAWEASNTDNTKSWANTDLAKDVAANGYKNIQLTKEQMDTLKALREKENTEFARNEEERFNQLIQQHQSYTDQRLEIDRRYQEEVTAYETAIAELRKKLATAGTDEERQAIEGQIEALTRSLGEAAKGRLKELSDVAGRELQDSPLFSLAWKDLQNVSTETLNMLIEKFKEVEGQFSGDPQAMKEWTERIQAMSDEVVSRNPFKALAQARQEIEDAQERKNKAKGWIDNINAEIESIRKSIAEAEENIELDDKTGADSATKKRHLKELAEQQDRLAASQENLKEATKQYGDAVVDEIEAEDKRKTSMQNIMNAINGLSSSIKGLGSAIGGTEGEILNVIGDVMDFVTMVSDSIQNTSSQAVGALKAIETASTILAIISAAIQLLKKVGEMLPDTFQQYEKYRDKVNEVNKMEQAVRDYEMAVLEAKNAEKSWFASSAMRDLSKQWLVSSKASENYFKKLNELQATYQNESGSGWLTKLGAQANKTIASITGKVNELVGIEDTFLGNMQTKLAQFGWANAMGGQIGMNMYLENEIWDKGFDKNYVEGLTAAWRNLRIETRKASNGFLGTGVGGHSQRTEDLVQYVKKELGLDLFDKDGWLNQEAYEQVIEKYGDKLVGETKETLEALNELKEKHDEFLEQLHQFVNEMYSPIMTNFNDAMWEWYDEGTDALEAFQKAAGDTFRKIVSDLLDTQMLKLFGNEMSETITQLYTDYFDKGTISYGELMSGVTQAVDTASAKFVEAQPVLKATMLSVEESLSKMGIEMKSMGDTASGMFSDLSQAYRSMLLNMESDTKDFGDEVIRILTESLIDKFILGDEFEKKIEEITKKATSIVEATHVVVDADGNRTFISSIEEGVIKAQNSIAEYENQIQELSKRLANEQSSIMQEHVKELEKLRKKQEELDRQWLDNKLTQSQYNEAVEALAEEMAALEIAYEQQAQENEKILAITAEIDSREQRIRELKQDIYNIEHSETITEEERKAALVGVQDELQREYELRQGLVKTMKDMMGLTMIERISATSLSNVGEELLSMLQDTSKSVDDWKDEIVKTMTDDLIKEVVYSDSYKKAIREYQEEYVNILGSDMDTADKQAALSDLADRMADFASDTAAVAGIIKQSSGSMESSFGDLHDSLMSSFLDMENGAQNFAKTLQETLTKDLIDKFVFGQAFELNGKDFENFDAYQKDWTERYLAALEKGDKELMGELTREMEERREAMAAEAAEYAKTANEAISDTTFTDMEDSFVSALMNTEGSVEDFANDLKKTIVQKLVESFMVSEKIKPLLDDLQKTFDFAMGFNGATTEDRANIIAGGYTEYLEDGTAVIHKGVNDIADELSPIQEVVKSIMTDIGYEVKEGAGEAQGVFDSLGDNILDSLMNTESGVEDFMESITSTIARELTSSYMASEGFRERLAYVKNQMEEAVKSGDTKAIDDAKQAIEDLYQSAADETKEYRKALEKLEQTEKEVDTTFKDMAESWISHLMDFNATAEEWAENIGRTMAQKIVEQMVATELMQPLLDSLQTAFDTAMGYAGEGTLAERLNLVLGDEGIKGAFSEIMEAYPSIQEMVKGILGEFGITPEVEAAKTAFGDLTGTIVDGLTDAEMTVEEFGRSIAKTLTEQMIQQLVETQFANTIESIKKEWAQALESGDITKIDAVKQEIIQLYSAAGEATEGLREVFKTIEEESEEADETFKGMADSWTSMLTDMDADAESWGREIGRTLVTKMVKEMVVDKHLQPYLDKIQEVADAAMGKEGATMESVIAAVTPEIDKAVEATKQWKPVVDAVNEAFQEIEENIEETDETPFDNLRSSLLSALMDMNGDAKDWSKSIAESLTEAFIDKFVLGEAFDKRLADWQEEYRDIMDGTLSPEERAKQLKELGAVISDAKEGYAKEAKAIHELMGTAEYGDQDATMNMADKATYDQFEMYLGIALSQQMCGEQQLSIQQQILSTLQAMSGITSPNNDALLTQVAIANGHLQQISNVSSEIKQLISNISMNISSLNGRI